MAGMLTSLSVATAVWERSVCRSFAIYGLRAQHFADSMLVCIEKLRKYYALTVWHVLSDYGGLPIH